jgi:hypothetical protein
MRMGKPPFNTNQREHANVVTALLLTPGFRPVLMLVTDVSRFNGLWRKGDEGSR